MSLPRKADAELLGIRFDEGAGRGSFALRAGLLRHDGALYGGTAIAASVVAMEAATDREAQWVTTQFVATAQEGETIDLRTEVLASGRRTAQVRVTGTVQDRVVFAALGSTGVRKPDGLSGQFERMPEVTGPEDAGEVWPGPRLPHMSHDGTFRRAVEHRPARLPEGPGPVLMWSRFIDGRTMTPAGLAFVADMVPLAIARGAGKIGAGTSLDNSMRFGEVPEMEWVLLELRGNLAAGGYGHGLVLVWSQEGQLLAVGSQTASMSFIFGDEPSP